MNSFRYLVFFDDGYASYIKHEDIRVVCQQTENAVWEDVHSNSRDFVKKYLQQYPERPMVKLSLQQNVSVELEGSIYFIFDKICLFQVSYPFPLFFRELVECQSRSY